MKDNKRIIKRIIRNKATKHKENKIIYVFQIYKRDIPYFMVGLLVPFYGWIGLLIAFCNKWNPFILKWRDRKKFNSKEMAKHYLNTRQTEIIKEEVVYP